MRPHRHILVPHCNGHQACKWLICVVCNEYGDDPPGSGRWTRNPYEFLAEPKPDDNKS